MRKTVAELLIGARPGLAETRPCATGAVLLRYTAA